MGSHLTFQKGVCRSFYYLAKIGRQRVNNLSADSRGATEKFPFAERAKTLVPDDDHGGERERERQIGRERGRAGKRKQPASEEPEM